MGMDRAFTALADGPSAAYYHPGGLPFSEGQMFAGSRIVVDVQSIKVNDALRVHPQGDTGLSAESRASGPYPSSGSAVSVLLE